MRNVLLAASISLAAISLHSSPVDAAALPSSTSTPFSVRSPKSSPRKQPQVLPLPPPPGSSKKKSGLSASVSASVGLGVDSDGSDDDDDYPHHKKKGSPQKKSKSSPKKKGNRHRSVRITFLCPVSEVLKSCF
jgi:hypothetical protein